MTILPAPAPTGSAASTSQLQHPFESPPLKEQRRRLLETQNQITQIDRIKTQLQQLLPRKRKSRDNARSLSPSSDVSSWSIASTSSKGSIASDIKGRELLVPLSSVAFVSATIPRSDGIGQEEEDTPSVYLRSNFRNLRDSNFDNLVLLDDAASGKERGNYEEMSISSAIARLDEQRQGLEKTLLTLRDEVVSVARATLVEHLGGQPESASADAVTPVNDQGQALNEEGLPFVDPIEPLAEGQERSGVSALAPQVREAMTKEERKNWMESLLSKLEDEEKGETQEDGDSTTHVSSPSRQRPEVHRRLSSAERPAPPKSVLKQTGPLPLPIPKFGSSGFRRGFLNLNPSSPAAEHSSDPVEAIDFSQSDTKRHVRGNISVDDSFSSTAINSRSDEERMSRSMELPAKKGNQPKRKKTVRILSPERENGSAPKTPLIKSEKVKSVRDAEDDGQEEAASILELLGLDAIKDHPQAAGLYEALKDSERMEQLAQKVDAARITALKKEAGHVKKPAVSQTVMERPSGEMKDAKDTGGFKRGFLNQSAKSSISAVPAGPTISQGVSALDRATQSDAGLEQERMNKGLKPAVPHARPSKAFAEKMEAKRRGEEVARGEEGQEEEETPARMSKVRFGGLETKDDEGEEKDESLDSIGMHISEEELDEDTVEALGYFSDEDYDPDIGLSDEEILLSRPQFNADGSEITNEELRGEYERIKATLGSSQYSNGAVDIDDDDDDKDDFLEGTDLSLQNGGENSTKVSRFKQERAKRALSGQSAISNELGTGLDKAQNIGPRMLIPSIANVRFPVQGHEAVEGQEVQLQGQDDEEDDDLEELMRQRLIQRDQATINGTVRKSAEATMPPQIVSAKSLNPEAQQAAPSIPPVKKPSLFKSRMSQK